MRHWALAAEAATVSSTSNRAKILRPIYHQHNTALKTARHGSGGRVGPALLLIGSLAFLEKPIRGIQVFKGLNAEVLVPVDVFCIFA